MKTSHLRRTLLLWLPATTVLHGCGSGHGDHDSAATGAAPGGRESGGLPADARPDQIPAIEPKIWGLPQNLRSDYNWFTPDGHYAGVVVDQATGIHTVPPGPAPRIGRRSFDLFMMPDRRFELTLLDAGPADLVLRMTPLQRDSEQPLALPAGPIEARPGTPAVFTLPMPIDRFTLEYESQDPAGARFGLQLREEAQPGANLLGELPTGWHQWTGDVQPAVTFAGKYGQVWVEPPAGGGLTQAVNRYTAFPSFESGRRYELKLRADPAGSAASLFFFDDQYRLIAVDGADWVLTIADQPWLDSGGQGGTRFTWPAGVAYFVLQVQGRWNATSRDILWPELVEAG